LKPDSFYIIANDCIIRTFNIFLMNTNSVEKASCFRSFSQDVSSVSLPEKMNFPFYYEVHPLCKIAAAEIQFFLEKQQDIPHNFGLKSANDLLPVGKMFGVLVVEYHGKLGYIAAYSGKLGNSNSVAF